MNALELRRRTLGKGVYKKTVEGNPAIAQGSLARRYPGITMQGWTEQAQYEGNQLFDGVFTVDTVLDTNGETVPYSGRSTTDFIKVKQSTDYTGFTRYLRACYYDAGKVIISYDDDTVTRQTPEGCEYVRFCFINGSNVMFNEGSTALPYEPYTGGAPSPSPDYPQEIVSAGKYDEGTGKWKYEVKLTGKNLFDVEYFKTTNDWKQPENMNGYPYIPIYIGKGNTITISTDGMPVEGLGFYCTIARTNKNTSNSVYTWLYHSTNTNLIKTNVSFEVVDDDYIYFALNGGKSNIEKFLNAFTNFQIEISAQKTEYQSYKEQTVTLTSDRPLTKWDRLEKRNGVWGWLYKSAEYTMTGEETFYVASESYIGELTSDSYIIVNNLQEINGCCGFSNYLKIYVGVWGGNFDGVEGFAYNSTQIHVRISNEDTGIIAEDTVGKAGDKIKAYCAQRYADGTPFIFWHETTEETFVPLSETEQEAMNALHTFRPTTVLSNDCDCNMTLTYKTKKSLEVTD